MNQGKIWTVVHPTVGLPLFLGSIAITSLIVHFAVLTHTTWMSSYWQGGHAKTSMATPATNGADVASLTAKPSAQ